jgi:polysaccharide biosynthesis transport protein
MAQYEFQLADYERIFRKRYMIVVLTMICGAIFAIMIARTKVPVFYAQSSVKVDRNSTVRLGMESNQFDTWDNIETQTSVITSFPVLLKAAKKLGRVPPETVEDTLPSNESILGLLESLRGIVTATVSSSANIITIAATSTRREEARDVANAMAFSYKEFSLQQKRLFASKTKAFVTKQLDLCRSELTEVEQAIADFESGQKIPSVDASAAQVIKESEDLDVSIKGVENSIAVIKSQEARLNAPFDPKAVNPVVKTDSVLTPADSLSMLARTGWVSEFTDADPGFAQLCGRLLQFQLQYADLSAFYKKDHPAVKELQKKINETKEQVLAQYRSKTAALEEKMKELQEKKTDVDKQMNLIPISQMNYARLLRKMHVKEALYTALETKYQETLITEAGIVDEVTIMSVATLPANPVDKGLPKTVLIGAVLGLLFGIVFAVLREMLDTSIGTIEDVERALKVTVLAVIPHIRGDDKKGRKKASLSEAEQVNFIKRILVTHFNPKDPSAEAYRILRTNIGYLSFNKPLQTILLTSAAMQEGKSTTISNLAVAFAQQGKNILLIECNLRRPSLHRSFGIERKAGVADILIGKVPWRDCIMTVTDLALGKFTLDEILKVPGLDKLNIIPYGHRPPNPTELLSSSRMDTFLKEVRDYYDIILVDGPPILPVADSIVLSTKVDGVIFVYKAGKTPRNSLRLAKERIETVHANLLGVALNDLRPETTGSTYSAYIYRYAKDVPKSEVKGFKKLLNAIGIK